MDYAKKAQKALLMLQKFGQVVRVRKYTTVAHNKTTGESVRTWEDTQVYGALFDFFFGETAQTGTEIEKGDKRLYLAPTVEISPSDVTILIGTTEYQVVGMREVNPAGTVVLYDLHVRK